MNSTISIRWWRAHSGEGLDSSETFQAGVAAASSSSVREQLHPAPVTVLTADCSQVDHPDLSTLGNLAHLRYFVLFI